jgi:hypothetical protein
VRKESGKNSQTLRRRQIVETIQKIGRRQNFRSNERRQNFGSMRSSRISGVIRTSGVIGTSRNIET